MSIWTLALRPAARAWLIDKFRPAAAAGSYEWNYRLTVEGWRLLNMNNYGMYAEEKPYTPADIHSIAYVEHDLQARARGWTIR